MISEAFGQKSLQPRVWQGENKLEWLVVPTTHLTPVEAWICQKIRDCGTENSLPPPSPPPPPPLPPPPLPQNRLTRRIKSCGGARVVKISLRLARVEGKPRASPPTLPEFSPYVDIDEYEKELDPAPRPSRRRHTKKVSEPQVHPPHTHPPTHTHSSPWCSTLCPQGTRWGRSTAGWRRTTSTSTSRERAGSFPNAIAKPRPTLPWSSTSTTQLSPLSGSGGRPSAPLPTSGIVDFWDEGDSEFGIVLFLFSTRARLF